VQRAAGRWIVLLLAGLTLLPFLPALLHGNVLTFRDHADYFVPLRWFTTMQLRAGSIPWWNPFNGGGEAWLANPQTGVFYPPALLFLPLPFSTAYVLFVALHLFLLALFTFRLFSRFASSEAALFGSLAASFCGPVLSLLDVQNNLTTLCWIPFALDVLSGDSAPATKRVGLGAFAFALMFLGGEPFYSAVGAVLVLVAAFMARRWKGVAEAAAAGALALLICAPQLFPFLQMLRGSDRAAGLTSELALRNSVSAREWLFAVVPAWPSTLSVASQQFIPSLYLSSLVLAFAILGLAAIRSTDRVQRKASLASVLLFSFALFYALGSNVELVGRTILTLHLNISRYPARILPFAALALAALAALGWDRMLARTTRNQRLTVLLALAVIGGLAIHSSSARTATLIDVAVALIVVTLSVRLQSSVTARRAVIGLVAATLLPAHAPFFASHSISALSSPFSPSLDRKTNLVRLIAPDRPPGAFDLAGKRDWMSGYLNLLPAIHDVSTPAPVVSLEYQRVHDAAVSAANSSLINALSIGAVLSSRPLPQSQLQLRGRSGHVTLYRNEAALPMITFWEEPSHCASSSAALSKLLRSDATRFICVVDGRDEGRPSRLLSSTDARFEGTNRVAASINAPRDGLVMLNQNDAEGWSVLVDGKASTKRLVDGIFRGVEVRAGAHNIEWRYEPPHFRLALLLAFFGVTAAAVLTATRQG
jgi:hypothetical protein